MAPCILPRHHSCNRHLNHNRQSAATALAQRGAWGTGRSLPQGGVRVLRVHPCQSHKGNVGETCRAQAELGGGAWGTCPSLPQGGCLSCMSSTSRAGMCVCVCVCVCYMSITARATRGVRVVHVHHCQSWEECECCMSITARAWGVACRSQPELGGLHVDHCQRWGGGCVCYMSKTASKQKPTSVMWHKRVAHGWSSRPARSLGCFRHGLGSRTDPHLRWVELVAKANIIAMSKCIQLRMQNLDLSKTCRCVWGGAWGICQSQPQLGVCVGDMSITAPRKVVRVLQGELVLQVDHCQTVIVVS